MNQSSITHANTVYDVIIVGGGLAGLISAIELSRNGIKTLLIEKKSYPFHKVCGEYVSNEVLRYLISLGFDPHQHNASSITQLRVSTPHGKNYVTPLDLGGFGISRYVMDTALFGIVQASGADTLINTKVTDIRFDNATFTVQTFSGECYQSKLVIASHGKRDVLDKKLERKFIARRTGYLGVKYHIKTDYPANEIGLDNFSNGYCGITAIEDGIYNLCYLYKKDNAVDFKNIPELEETVLFKNPILKHIFKNADFVLDKPEVINEICFDKKEAVYKHILMCGDSAGLITPLCGNGMSMAIGGAKILCTLILQSGIINKNEINAGDRTKLEHSYQRLWNTNFGQRLFWGRLIQSAFGNPAYTGLFINTIYNSPARNWLIRQTHGKPLI